jgi:DNA-binding beta-propeller fold protein YncE
MKDRQSANYFGQAPSLSASARTASAIRKTLSLAATAALILAAGCATHSKSSGPKYNFFPPPPDAPHVQFLTAFSSEKDLREGKGEGLMSYITGEKPPERPIGKPYGVAIRGKKIYICDTAGRLLQADMENRRLFAVDTRGPGALKLPLNMVFDADGTMYVADSLRNEVVIFDASENFITAVGDKATMKPRDVAVGPDKFYVADMQNHCVHVYDKSSRNFLFSFPRGGEATNDDTKLFMPTNLALDSHGNIYASDAGAFRIQVYDADGKYVRTVGRYGDNVGEFARPKGIAVDRENRLYAVDFAFQAVQIFDDQGHLLMWFGEPSASKVGLEAPAKVIVDYDHVDLFQKYAAPNFQVEHLIIVINQFGPRKVSIYGFGHKR